MKIKKSSFIKSILIIFVIFSFLSLFANGEYRVDVSYKGEKKINKPLEITFVTKKRSNIINPENIEIKLYNKYNKDERIETTIQPFTNGTYKIFFTPNYGGEYNINIKFRHNESDKLFNKTFEIE